MPHPAANFPSRVLRFADSGLAPDGVWRVRPRGPYPLPATVVPSYSLGRGPGHRPDAPPPMAARPKPAQGCVLCALAGRVDALAGTVWWPFVRRADPNPTARVSPSCVPHCTVVGRVTVGDAVANRRRNAGPWCRSHPPLKRWASARHLSHTRRGRPGAHWSRQPAVLLGVPRSGRVSSSPARRGAARATAPRRSGRLVAVRSDGCVLPHRHTPRRDWLSPTSRAPGGGEAAGSHVAGGRTGRPGRYLGQPLGTQVLRTIPGVTDRW